MSFLHAWALALGLAAVVPFILHLRRRETDRRVSFPALRYLTSAEDARSRSLVASDLLLLATRIGLLIAIALAAAGPLLGRGGAADHEPTDIAVIVDNSASTGRVVADRPLFETILDRTREALEATRPEDRVWLFPTVGDPVAAGVSGPRAAEALPRVERSAGASDLAEVVLRASAALPVEGDRRREILLVSDLQRSAFAAPAVGGAEGVPVVAWIPPPPAEANGAIADLELSGGTTVPSGAGHGLVVRAVRAGAGDGAAADNGTGGAGGPEGDEAALRLEVDGRIAGAARAAWGASATLALPDLATGSHEGRVEVDPSGARPDDVRFFALHVVPPPAVRFIGPDGSFARVGIETLRQAGRLGEPGGATVTVLEGVPGATASASLPDVRGTLVLLPPADPVDLPAFNQLLERLGTGWTLRSDPTPGGLAFEEPGAGFSLSGIRVRQRYLLRAGGGGPAAGDSAIISTEDGEPWLMRTSGGLRTVLLAASPLTPEAGDLPTHPAILPFLEALLVQWSHISAWPPSDFEAGAPLSLPAWAEEVTDPSGAVTSVEGGSRYVGHATGIYTVSGADADGAGRSARFAVNVPEREMDPTPARHDELEELFPDRAVFTGGPEAGGWTDEIFRGRRGRDAAPWLLALALALAALELFLATPGSGRRRERAWRAPDPEADATPAINR